MADPKQMAMDDILSDEPAEKKAPDEPRTEEVAGKEPDASVEAEAKAAAEEKKADYMSKRQRARNKEAIAQGKVLDPDTGQFVSPSETKEPEPAKADPKPVVAPAPAAPQQEFTEKEKAFLRAAQEERGKRQELERRLAAIESPKPKEPEKTFWDDPDGALRRQKEEFEQRLTGSRLQQAEVIARSRYQDFDAKVAIFSELAQSTPGLAQQMIAAPDPAEFVYRTAANHQAIKDAGGIDELRKKIEAETEAKVRTKIEAELKAKADALAKERAALPPSLSEARSTGGAQRQVWSGPTSMTSILNDK